MKELNLVVLFIYLPLILIRAQNVDIETQNLNLCQLKIVYNSKILNACEPPLVIEASLETADSIVIANKVLCWLRYYITFFR